MKIAFIPDASLGLASAQLVKQAFEKAISEQPEYSLASVAEAETVIVAGDPATAATHLTGKQVATVESQSLLSDAKTAVAQAVAKATSWKAPAVAPISSSASASTVKKIVAVTACPTGVAHTFMAAEAIEAEAKKRGWPVRVETRGSVGAGNPITPEEVADADIVFIAADIEVDLAKFAGKPMYRTSTGLALKKTAQEFDKALNEAKPYQSGKSSAQAASGNSGDKKEIRRLSSPTHRCILYVTDGSRRRTLYRTVFRFRDQCL